MKLPRLREVREQHGWSQQKLSEESGVSRDSISNYETGQREAWPATAKRLSDALGVEIADLIARLEEPEELLGKAPGPVLRPKEQRGADEERSLPTAEEMDSVTAFLERLVAQRHKIIDEWRDNGVDAFEAAICGSIEMDAANDQIYRDLQDRGSDKVLERWKNNPNLVAEVDSKAARREADAFYELLQTAVRARNVTQELARQSDSSRGIAGVEEERLEAIPNNVLEFKTRAQMDAAKRRTNEQDHQAG